MGGTDSNFAKGREPWLQNSIFILKDKIIPTRAAAVLGAGVRYRGVRFWVRVRVRVRVRFEKREKVRVRVRVRFEKREKVRVRVRVRSTNKGAVQIRVRFWSIKYDAGASREGLHAGICEV